MFTFRILFLITSLSMFMLSGLVAQTTLLDAPNDWQLYPRDEGASFAEAKISGIVAAGSSTLRLSAKLTNAIGVISTDTVILDYSQGDAVFELRLQIPVTRTLHRIEIFEDDATSAMHTADYIVAGDVYVINGQSNAEADGFIQSVDKDSFVRGYNEITDSDFEDHPRWTQLQYASSGQWAGRMTKRLSTAEDLPIAVFNFAKGGKPIRYFLEGHPSNNFADVFNTLDTAGVLGQVHSFFWSQGEADGFGRSTRVYRAGLESLFSSYVDSFGTDRAYLLQTRAFSCDTWTPFIMEAQRRYAVANRNVTLFSTVNVLAEDDRCHFPYEEGYETIGNRLADLLLDRSYNDDLPHAYSPTPDSASITGPQEITVYMSVPGSTLAFSGTPWEDFQAEGINKRAVSGTITASSIVLAFDTLIATASGVSYFANQDQGYDYVHNSRGVGIALWYDLSLVPNDGIQGSAVDAAIRLNLTEAPAAVGEDCSVEIIIDNQGTRSITDAVVRFPLPLSFSYDSDAFEPSDGEVLADDESWYIPTIRPGASETLAVNYVWDSISPEPIVWAQLVELDQDDDPDSEEANGVLFSVREDDEARLHPLSVELNCQLETSLLNSSCDSVGLWELTFDLSDTGLDSISFDVSPLDAVVSIDSVLGVVTLSFDTLAKRDTTPVDIVIEKTTGAYTCSSSYEALFAPLACVVTPPDTTTIDTSLSTAPILGVEDFKVYPNPSKLGSQLSIFMSSNARAYSGKIELYACSGILLNSYAKDTELIETANLAAGMYYLKYGYAIRKILITR